VNDTPQLRTVVPEPRPVDLSDPDFSIPAGIGAVLIDAPCAFEARPEHALDTVDYVFESDEAHVEVQVSWLLVRCGPVCVGRTRLRDVGMR
jgi:hypothetical protein